MRAKHAAAIACLAVAACVHERADLDLRADARPVGHWRVLEPTRVRAELDLPGVGARERRTRDGELVQDLVLANDTRVAGENRLTLAVDYGPPDGRVRADGPRLGRYGFTPAELEAELARALPGARIAPGPVLRSNGYGPYYAVTAEYPGEAACVFAWQVIDGGAHLPPGARRASLVLRWCTRAANADGPLRAFDRLRLAV
ncbi:MAG TPA: cellulose biosynthesis protein BcsN [Azospirillaceae bacterium]|nr:cellulose biosynthesis protein BcsN [Azospirillaceae bacterium]